MLYDVVLSRDGRAQNLYYAPYREGPHRGEYFFVDDDDMTAHKADETFSGVYKYSSLWNMLKMLGDCEIYKIRSVIHETPMVYYEEEEEKF